MYGQIERMFDEHAFDERTFVRGVGVGRAQGASFPFWERFWPLWVVARELAPRLLC